MATSADFREVGHVTVHEPSLFASSGSHCPQRMRFKPEHAGGREWIYSGLSPPRPFIAAAMDLAMMRATQRHRKFVAHLATERTRLRKAQMVRIRRPPTANQTRLLHHMPDMVPITNAARFGKTRTLLYRSLMSPGLLG